MIKHYKLIVDTGFVGSEYEDTLSLDSNDFESIEEMDDYANQQAYEMVGNYINSYVEVLDEEEYDEYGIEE